jgi:hypothetical protein
MALRGEALRRLLGATPSLPGVRAAAESGELGFALATDFTEHVAAVYGRVERAVADEPCALALKLVALVHEEQAARVGALLERAGVAAEAPLAAAVVADFGALWKLGDRADHERFACARVDRLRPLLLFEIAHEGEATAAMRSVASVAGLDEALVGWLQRLRA